MLSWFGFEGSLKCDSVAGRFGLVRLATRSCRFVARFLALLWLSVVGVWLTLWSLLVWLLSPFPDSLGADLICKLLY